MTFDTKRIGCALYRGIMFTSHARNSSVLYYLRVLLLLLLPPLLQRGWYDVYRKSIIRRMRARQFCSFSRRLSRLTIHDALSLANYPWHALSFEKRSRVISRETERTARAKFSRRVFKKSLASFFTQEFPNMSMTSEISSKLIEEAARSYHMFYCFLRENIFGKKKER